MYFIFFLLLLPHVYWSCDLSITYIVLLYIYIYIYIYMMYVSFSPISPCVVTKCNFIQNDGANHYPSFSCEY